MAIRRTRPVSRRLLQALDALALDSRRQGVRLFLFGSIARTYPESYLGADLDLGYEPCEGASITPEAVRHLEAGIRQLPTVRPVDLVDFRSVDPRFAKIARQTSLDLPVSRP